MLISTIFFFFFLTSPASYRAACLLPIYIKKKKKGEKSRCALLNDRKEMGRKIKESFYTGDREGSIPQS